MKEGKNRYLFEDALVDRMRSALSRVEGCFEVVKEQGRIYVYCPEQYDYDETIDALRKVFGIVYICPVMIFEDRGIEQTVQDVVYVKVFVLVKKVLKLLPWKVLRHYVVLVTLKI